MLQCNAYDNTRILVCGRCDHAGGKTERYMRCMYKIARDSMGELKQGRIQHSEHYVSIKVFVYPTPYLLAMAAHKAYTGV